MDRIFFSRWLSDVTGECINYASILDSTVCGQVSWLHILNVLIDRPPLIIGNCTAEGLHCKESHRTQIWVVEEMVIPLIQCFSSLSLLADIETHQPLNLPRAVRFHIYGFLALTNIWQFEIMQERWTHIGPSAWISATIIYHKPPANNPVDRLWCKSYSLISHR
jgi:hypothetical protein